MPELITVEVEMKEGFEPTGKAWGEVGVYGVDAVYGRNLGGMEWMERKGCFGIPFRRIQPPYEPVKVKLQPMATAPRDGKEFFAVDKDDQLEPCRYIEANHFNFYDPQSTYKGWFRVEVEG